MSRVGLVVLKPLCVICLLHSVPRHLCTWR